MAVLKTFSGTITLTGKSKLEQKEGPLLDNGASHSALGTMELKLLFENVRCTEKTQIEHILDSIYGFTHFQYRAGEHVSAPGKILRLIVITAKEKNAQKVSIRHLAIDGNRKWVIGIGITKYCHVLHMDQICLQLIGNGVKDYFSVIAKNLLSYIPMSAYMSDASEKYIMSYMTANIKEERSWSYVKAIVSKVHRHVCGHASFTCIRIVLEQNDLWSDEVTEHVF